ncbi:hypothetical protein XENTR_v10019381 [Xenopus tropicalis]|nr:hypothetical protein XENTR_v10019381 [Xenopus tropicalis]
MYIGKLLRITESFTKHNHCGCASARNENMNLFISISADRITKQPCQPCKGYQKCLNEVLHCKDQDLRVAEGEDLKFDCNLNFLNSVDEKFEFVLEKREELDVSLMQTSNKPDIFIHKANKDVSGRYSCTAKSKDAMFPISRVDFTVKGKYLLLNSTDSTMCICLWVDKMGISTAFRVLNTDPIFFGPISDSP